MVAVSAPPFVVTFKYTRRLRQRNSTATDIIGKKRKSNGRTGDTSCCAKMGDVLERPAGSKTGGDTDWSCKASNV